MIHRSHDRGIQATKFGSEVIHPLAQVTLAVRVGLDHFQGGGWNYKAAVGMMYDLNAAHSDTKYPTTLSL